MDTLKDSNIIPEVAKLYVDGKTIVMEPVPLGAKYRDGRVREIGNIENNRSIPGDLKTAGVLKYVGNSICQFIKVTVDCG